MVMGMEILILLLTVLLLIGLIAAMVMRIMGIRNAMDLIFKMNLILFVLISFLIGFYPYEGIGVALETVSFYLMTGFLSIALWKFLFSKEDMKIWIFAWGGSSGIYLLSILIKYSHDGIIQNVVDFGIILIPSMVALIIVSMIKKNDYGRILSKALIVVYILFSILFSIMPPNDLGTAVMSFIITLLIGGICGIGLFIPYRKIYSPTSSIYKMLDEQ